MASGRKWAFVCRHFCGFYHSNSLKVALFRKVFQNFPKKVPNQYPEHYLKFSFSEKATKMSFRVSPFLRFLPLQLTKGCLISESISLQIPKKGAKSRSWALLFRDCPRSFDQTRMHLVEIRTFSLNNVIVRLTKIMNKADRNWAHF